MIRVDYQCPSCGVTEHQVASPPPEERPCPTCTASARRRFSPVGRGSGAVEPQSRPAGRSAHAHSSGCLCGIRPEVLAASRSKDPDVFAEAVASTSPRSQA